MESIDGLPWRDTNMHGRERECEERDQKRKEDREKFIVDTEC